MRKESIFLKTVAVTPTTTSTNGRRKIGLCVRKKNSKRGTIRRHEGNKTE